MVTMHIHCVQYVMEARRKTSMLKGTAHTWKSVVISGILGIPHTVAIVAIKGEMNSRELIHCLVDSGALLPSNVHTASLWHGGEKLEPNYKAQGDSRKDGLMIRLQIHDRGPQILTTKMGTIMPRLVNSSQLQRLQAAGATLAELDAAMEAGIEGFRCDCRFAEHSNERCGIWLPTRGI